MNEVGALNPNSTSAGEQRFTGVRRHFPVAVDESGTLVLSFQGLAGSSAAVAALEVMHHPCIIQYFNLPRYIATRVAHLVAQHYAAESPGWALR